MVQPNENFLSMTAATLKVLNENSVIWNGNVPFWALVSALSEDMHMLNLAQQGGGALSTGATADKETAGDAAIAKAVQLSRLAQVYALDKGNMTLHNQVKVTASYMDRYGDAELTAALDGLYNAMAAMPDAAAYGITASELQKLKDLTTAFDNIKSAPRVIISGRKNHNDNIPALIRHVRGILHKTDRLTGIWAETSSAFIRTYTNARIIIDLGKRYDTEVA